jgi:hypothetical protein
VLTICEQATAREVAAAAAEGVGTWGQHLVMLCKRVAECNRVAGDKPVAVEQLEKEWEKLTDIVSDHKVLQKLHSSLSAEAARWLSSLAGVEADLDKKGKPIGWKTTSGPLKFTSAKMAYVGAMYALISSGSKSSNRPERIEKALFEDWTYSDPEDTLRYAPSEARRYALQGADPTVDTAYRKMGAHTERGASILASLGILSMPMATTRVGCQVPGFLSRRPGAFVWPIWRPAARLSSLEVLLTQQDFQLRAPALAPEIALAMIAVRTRVTDQGNYYNVAQAVRHDPAST